MLYSRPEMPVVFVIAEDWTLRTGVRAELRERGIAALGMDSAAEVGKTLAGGDTPGAIVLEAGTRASADPAVQRLCQSVTTFLVASRMQSREAASRGPAAKIFFRPVQIGEIVSAVLEALRGQRA
jgi:hypothetical protein